MRTILFFLLFSLCATQVYAEDRSTFTVDTTKYELTKPADWEEEAFSSGIQLTQKDKNASIAILVLPNTEGVTLDSFLQACIARLSLDDIKKAAIKGGFDVTGEKDQVKYRIRLKEEKGSFISLVAAGVDKKVVDAVSDSLKQQPTESGRK